MRDTLAVAIAGLAAASLTAGALAQGYPSKPVRMLVAFPAGGSADIVARVLGQRLSESVGQNFIIDNRPGTVGGGVVPTVFWGK